MMTTRLMRTLLALTLFVALPSLADPVGRLVDLGDGRKLHLVCFGSGLPTVVMESGAAEGFYTWWLVQQQLRDEVRTCSYDRAGFGWSDPPTATRSISGYVDDLHALLKAAGEKPPFILAGHSMGSTIVQRYYWRFPKEVSGIILVDPANSEAGFPHFPAMEQAVRENRTRRTKEMEEWRRKNRWPQQSFPSELPKDLRDKLVAASGSRNWWEARFAEGGLPDLEVTMTVEERRINVPLIVITAASPSKPPGWSDETQSAYQARWIAMHDELASRSPNSKRVLAPASHRVQMEASSFVSDQIRAMLRMLAPSPSSR